MRGRLFHKNKKMQRWRQTLQKGQALAGEAGWGGAWWCTCRRHRRQACSPHLPPYAESCPGLLVSGKAIQWDGRIGDSSEGGVWLGAGATTAFFANFTQSVGLFSIFRVELSAQCN